MDVKIAVRYLNPFVADHHKELSEKTMNQLKDTLMYISRHEDRLVSFNIDHWSDEELEIFKAHVKPFLDEDGSINPVLQALSVTARMRKNPTGIKVPSLEKFPSIFYNWVRSMSQAGRIMIESNHGHLLQFIVEGASYTPRQGEYEAYCDIRGGFIKNWSKDTKRWTFYQQDVKGKTISEVLQKKGIMPVGEEDMILDAGMNEKYQEFCKNDGIQYHCGGYLYSASSNYYSRGDDYLAITDGIKHKLVSDDGSITDRVDGKKMRVYPTWYADKSDDDRDPLTCPIHHYARVYDLTKHRAVNAHINEITLYKYKPELIDKLIIPEDHKTLLETLALGTDKLAQDVVENKTGGIIFLLSGAAGLGKTLSAEVFGEYLQRPLYIVQASQLGTSVNNLEENLKEVLSRTRRWNALLLIDEADVYVRRRGVDIQQNAVVGVFLRVLEYFSGVMMLTTNLPDIVDEAIISRMTAHIHFKHPNAAKREQIWKNNLDSYGVKYSAKDVKQVADCLKISGRLIKNMTKLVKFIIDMDNNDYKVFDIHVVRYAMNFSPANSGELEWKDGPYFNEELEDSDEA